MPKKKKKCCPRRLTGGEYRFVQAGDSRAPLSCSRESFSYTLTFHQVAPSFLDYVSSFGDTKDPLDFSMTAFQAEDSLGAAEEDRLNIPRIGRSGYEIRHSYILRSVESSDDDDDDEDDDDDDDVDKNGGGGGEEKPWPWRIRQTAVYHCFDVATGRAFWLTIKANDMMKKRITEAASTLPPLRASLLGDHRRGFAASLATHLIFLEWTDENWRQCINDIEGELRKILVKAKTARIDREPHFDAIKPLISRKTTMNQQHGFGANALPRSASKITTESVRMKAGSLASALWSLVSKAQVEKRGSVVSVGNPAGEKSGLFHGVKQLPFRVNKAAPSDGGDDDEALKSLQWLDMFSFAEMQKLHDIGERLEEMSLVVKLDADVLRDIRTYYASLMERDEFPHELRTDCAADVASFCRRVEGIEKNLRLRRSQLGSMICLLRDGKTLVSSPSAPRQRAWESAETDRCCRNRQFAGILQYRSVQVSRIFAESAHEQAEKMAKLAYKAEQETVSMHIITFVTLAFLPGTFVAVRFARSYLAGLAMALTFSDQTFFQSGLLQWPAPKDASTEPGADTTPMQFNYEGFRLFATITFPMMVITFTIWGLVYWWLQKRGRRKLADGEP